MGDIEIQRTPHVATLTLRHPGRHNAIDARMWRLLRESFIQFSADATLRCVVVQGADGQFAGGADITEFPQVRGTLAALREYHEGLIAPALAAISACVHPTVAAIDGACVGGGFEIAGRCDLRIASAGARIGVPIARLGFPMAPDELAGLLALAGRSVTLELLLEGRLLSAQEALSKNLITRMVPDGELSSAVARCVGDICAGAPLAARLNKRLIERLTSTVSPLSEDDLKLAFSYHDSSDHREGVSAFLEHRPARFSGH